MHIEHPNSILRMVLLATVLIWPGAGHAAETDIYLVYSAEVRGMKNELKKTLSSTYRVKTYNVGLLSIADYSGRQKIMAKLSDAGVIVLIGQRSGEVFEKNGRDNIVRLEAGVPDPAAIIRTWIETHAPAAAHGNP